MTSYKICSETGEDKSCSNKFAPEYSGADHNFYFFAIDNKNVKCWNDWSKQTYFNKPFIL